MQLIKGCRLQIQKTTAEDDINHSQSANSSNDSKDKIKILKDEFGKKNAEPHIEADNIKE